MKKTFITILSTISAVLLLGSCSMDLTPLSQGSSASWYTTETELDLAVNEFFIIGYWANPRQEAERWTDNFTYRNTNRATDILDGILNGDKYESYQTWEQNYKLIGRTNSLLNNIHRAEEAGMSKTKVNSYKAIAHFCRACKYGELIFFFGDVPYMEGTETISEAGAKGRMPKDQVKEKMYADFDFAIEHLPVVHNGYQYPTKGAAYAMKARYAMYNGDFAIAAEAAKACMDLKVYSLDADYSHVFLQGTKMIPEKIFVIPRSITNDVILDGTTYNNTLPRLAGGYAAYNPSWDLLAAYLCTDGLPIDQSPLFDPHKPFANRDPRCTMTIVEHETNHMGYVFNPRPDVKKVLKDDGTSVDNTDNRAVNQYAAFNGLLLKKGVDISWLDNGRKAEPDYLIMRYADVLLMYAEAKIELNDIDETVINAINQVRARAYGLDPSQTSFYPAVAMGTQEALRRVVRLERRVELSFEDLRYYDLIRWKLAGKVLNMHNYIMLQPQDCIDNVVNKGLWFWGETPSIDEDGVADFAPLCQKGYCMEGALRVFPERQYLFPIPSHEMDLCAGPNFLNNPGY